MANITIPNLPSAIALTGSEQVEIVQSNTSVRTTTQAIANLATVNVNAITSLTINSPLYASGSNPITSTGSIGLSSNGVTNNYLGTMPTLTLKGNNTGSTAAPTDLSVASVMTMLGAAPLASPTFTGTPRAPTPDTSDNSTQIATTAFVKAQASGTVSAGTAGQLAYYASTGSTVSGLVVGSGLLLSAGTISASGTSGVATFQTSLTGLTPSTATTGAVTLAGTLGGASGGTGVNNGTNTITIAGNVTTVGAFPLTVTTTGTTSVTMPTTGTLTALGNATTGSGSIVLATSPVLVTPTLGVATATSVNNVTITNPGTTAVLTLANGSTLSTAGSVTHAGAFAQTFTATGATTLTLPTTGTLATTGSTVASFQTSLAGLTPSTATTGAVTLAGTLGLGAGGTGTSTAFTLGSIVFAAAGGIYSQNNGALYFNGTGLGVGTNSVGGFNGTMTVGGAGTPTSGYLEGFQSAMSIGSSVTTRHDAFSSIPSTAAANFTLSNLNHFYAQSITLGSGSSITVQTAFNASSGVVGATYNYGFYSAIPSGTNNYAFYESAGAKSYFSGNVGIGTTAPDINLRVSGTYASIGAIDGAVDNRFVATSGGAAGIIGTYSNHPLVFYTNAAERMRIDSSGNVGIGTSSPSTKLNVLQSGLAEVARFENNATDAYFVLNQTQSGTSTRAVLSLQKASVNSLNISIDGSVTGLTYYEAQTSTGQHIFYTNSSERMRIDSSGNVGIGTSSPSNALSISKASGQAIIRLTDTTAVVDTYFITDSSGTTITQTSSLPLILKTANTERMRIDASGNVGIGTSSPGKNLQVYAAGTPAIALNNSTGEILQYINSSIGFFGTTSNTPMLFGANNSEAIRITGAGNVGIGTTSPTALLDVQSTTAGVRFPNMTTTQKNAISSPQAGTVVFDTTLSKLCVYSGAAWQTITSV